MTLKKKIIKPNVRGHYDYYNILLHNICMYLIFNDIVCKILTISSQEMFKLHFRLILEMIVEIREIFKLEHVNI